MTTTCLPTSTSSVKTLRAALTRLSRAGLTKKILTHPTFERRCPRLANDFIVLAHRHQEQPVLANGGGPWTTWLMLGGRGAGKTRLGAEWVRGVANGTAPYGEN